MLVVPVAEGAQLTLIAPRLEATPARACAAVASGAVTVVAWEETEDPMALVATTLETALHRPAHKLAAVAVSDGLRASFVLGLQRVLPGARFSLASAVLRGLRMRKDDDEVDLLRLAARAADRVIDAMAAGPLVGRTETDVAREVVDRLIAEGHEHAEFSIVASGPNSASPHHHPGDRVIQAGEPIVFDIGGTIGGYASDTTRMVWVTGGDPALGPDEEYLRLYAVLQRRAGRGDRRRAPGRGVRAGRRRRARDHRGRRLRTAVHPPDRPRHRARGPRGAVPRRRATGSPWRPGSRSAWSPASTSRGGTGRGSRTSSSAACRARSCSTRARATCASSAAERRPGPRPIGERRRGTRRAVSSADRTGTPGRTESPT